MVSQDNSNEAGVIVGKVAHGNEPNLFFDFVFVFQLQRCNLFARPQLTLRF
jgi:desulfoferrodoxin (superoxide reductase-like protein)